MVTINSYTAHSNHWEQAQTNIYSDDPNSLENIEILSSNTRDI